MRGDAMLKRKAVVCLFLFFAYLLGLTISYADNAEVLPKGISRAGVNGKIYLPIDERYDPEGKTEDVAVDFNATLDSSVFPALALVEAAAGLPTGYANIGRTDISFEYDFKIFEFTYQYGITDKLTFGVMVPYWDVTNDVHAKLITSNATVGKSATLNTLAPIGVMDTVPLTTDDAQALIGKGLDINGDGTVDIPGYGYKPIKKWSGSGISDIEVGLRYQYLKTDTWHLAFTGGARMPTGEKDDPDNLVDYPLGRGAWALLFRFNNDYVGIKNLILNATFRYDLYLPDSETKRILNHVDDVLTANIEKVDRDLGDVIELEGSATYEFTEGLNVSLLYKYGFAFKDRISGNKGFAYESLEDETDYTEHVGMLSLSYSTLPLYRAKKFPVPLDVSVSYRNRFAGSNNVMKSQYIGVGLNIYF
jgi:Putative MetA-pathway of phenol degradation